MLASAAITRYDAYARHAYGYKMPLRYARYMMLMPRCR